jgi:hypothetical protein
VFFTEFTHAILDRRSACHRLDGRPVQEDLHGVLDQLADGCLEMSKIFDIDPKGRIARMSNILHSARGQIRGCGGQGRRRMAGGGAAGGRSGLLPEPHDVDSVRPRTPGTLAAGRLSRHAVRLARCHLSSLAP